MVEEKHNTAQGLFLDFLDDHGSRIEYLKQEAYSALMACCDHLGISRNTEDLFIDLGHRIDEIKSFSLQTVKIENLRKVKGNLCLSLRTFASSTADTGSVIDPLSDKIEDVIILAREHDREIKRSVEDWLSNIHRCPFGEEENREKSALEFQRCVLNLFDWLFADELERMDLKDIEDGSQRRDGGYKALPGFRSFERCGFPFNQVFVECKNYKKPSYKDLMQVLAYTLSCQESKIFSIPLSILISRENPSVESLTWRMRGTIFNRRIEEEERLILFLDYRDLWRMVKYRKENGDPAIVIREKVQELSNWNVKRGG